MATPEQSQPSQTGRTDLDARARSTPEPGGADHLGPEPEENQPGHHPAEDQDKPPLDDFAARFGIVPDDEEVGTEERPQPAPETARPSADEAPGPAGEGATGRTLPAPVRQVWSVTVRCAVLPVLGGARAAVDVLERAARDSLR